MAPVKFGASTAVLLVILSTLEALPEESLIPPEFVAVIKADRVKLTPFIPLGSTRIWYVPASLILKAYFPELQIDA